MRIITKLIALHLFKMMRFYKSLIILVSFIFCSFFIFPQPHILRPIEVWEAEGLSENEIPLTMDMVAEEDLIINMYLNPSKIWSDDRTLKIESVLPFGKEGAYRITAMLFFMIAEYAEKKEKYENRIKSLLKYLIKKESVLYNTKKNEYKIIGGFTITFDEAKKYYEEALKNKFNEYEIKFLSNEENSDFKRLIYLYFLDPTNTNYKVIVEYMQKLYKSDLINFSSIIVYLNEVSNKFTNRLISSLMSMK